MSQVTDEIVALERRFWDESNNPHLFSEAIADGALTVIEPMGFIEKDQAVEAAGHGERWIDVEFSDVRIREMTPDCVILAYHGQGRRERDDKPYRGTIASTYVRRDARWQLGLTVHQPWDPASRRRA
ncbi:MAG: nuclear transport factor 2 family protein [Chloroflexota bacterium]|nr:nuclear transport factor 2 family protein [Chloroflexota bacterium]